jgi:hypothetical protein
VDGRGWVPAGELRPGDLLVSHDGRRVAVAELYDTGTYERVYNLAIRSFHTYFVCDETWPCSVWAHNSCGIPLNKNYDRQVQEVGDKISDWLGRGFRDVCNDERAFVAISRDGLRKFRIDFQGHRHQHRPHAHLQIFREDINRWVDAIPGRHFLDLQP